MTKRNNIAFYNIGEKKAYFRTTSFVRAVAEVDNLKSDEAVICKVNGISKRINGEDVYDGRKTLEANFDFI